MAQPISIGKKLSLTDRAQQLKALGDEHRLALILNVASAQCHNGMCICDVLPETGLAQSTVSHHMKILVDAGLLNRTQKGKWAYFELTPTGSELLLALNLGPLEPQQCSDCSS